MPFELQSKLLEGANIGDQINSLVKEDYIGFRV